MAGMGRPFVTAAAQTRRQPVAVEAAEIVEKRAYHACANR